MVILALDHGEKRIGLAVSDPLGIAAHGLPTLRSTTLQADIEALREIVADREVTEIVVGLPKNMDGSIGPQAEIAQEFGAQLEAALGLPVHFVDERLTSMRAERVLSDAGIRRRKGKSKVDRLAAQFILEQYLALRGLGEAEEEP